ncbi:hypothetical protein [Burkholderia cenocepacia]|uniref:hypothetical protein n=1 Tax=Burkholderia cenocepacia TaxID=95486 RepID=UPI0022374D03|nr:hypothetical protein [Burkholderia cenocepacia]MCW5156451.1 hypothetical protein [Burkholderia cenocepacia]
MENELAEKWRRLNSVLCISRGSYDIVQHIKTIFAWREGNSFRAYFGDYLYELDEAYKDKSIHYESIELSRYLIVKSIGLHNVDALDFLVSEKNGEKVRFYTLLQLLQLFHGLYVLDQIATNSDFWGHIDSGQIDDKTFLSFHVFNHTFHMGKRFINEINGSSNISNVLSLSFSSDFYEESKVMETRSFMSVFVSKLTNILRSKVFDSQFLDFYKEFEPISKNKEINKTGWGILEYLHESVAGGWAGERQLAVEKIESLIEE